MNLLGEQHDSGSWDKPECLWEAEPVKKQENFSIRVVLEFLKVSSKNVNLINVQNCIFLETEAKRNSFILQQSYQISFNLNTDVHLKQTTMNHTRHKNNLLFYIDQITIK